MSESHGVPAKLHPEQCEAQAQNLLPPHPSFYSYTIDFRLVSTRFRFRSPRERFASGRCPFRLLCVSQHADQTSLAHRHW
jgi:hypothetical protein